MNADGISRHFTGFPERTTVSDQTGQQRDSYLKTSLDGVF